MKRYLLDTHILLWWLSNPKKLSKNAITIMSEERIELFLSVASLWEIEIKRELGKLKIPKNLHQEIIEEGIQELPIMANHIHKLSSLPRHHNDPFDRILIAQALSEDFILITSDLNISKYSVPVLW